MSAESSLTLVMGPRAAGVARRFVREHCADHDNEAIETSELLVSELVGNAVRHGVPPVTIAVSCRERAGVTVWVSDGSQDAPRPRDAEANDEDGRGLRLVDVLSDDWGVEPNYRGKAVWFRLKTATGAA